MKQKNRNEFSNFSILVTAILAFGLGSFDVADNGLMNMMVGPELSKPLVQSLHAFVAFGNVLVAFIMPQMLPESSQGSNEDLCAKLKNPDQFQELDLDSSVMSGNLIGSWDKVASQCNQALSTWMGSFNWLIFFHCR